MTAGPGSGRGGLPHGRTFRTGTRAVFAVLVPGVGTFFKVGIIKRFFFLLLLVSLAPGWARNRLGCRQMRAL